LPPGEDDSTDSRAARPAKKWAGSGFFIGVGGSVNIGSFTDGLSHAVRGGTLTITGGYKGLFSDGFQLGLEVRPTWDALLGVFRLPITLSLGNDIFRLFGGPAFTFGSPSIDTSSGTRHYKSIVPWGELGASISTPPIKIASGGLSFYFEGAWQPYKRASDTDKDQKLDFRTASRFSLGLRYLWKP
jgi:hypothetical protein